MDQLMGIGIGIFLLLVFGSAIFYLYPPRKINWLYGYRMFSAMKSQAAWDFAQRYSAKLMLLYSSIGLLVQIALFFMVDDATSVFWVWMVAVPCIPLALVIQTERKLKQLEEKK